MNTFVPGLHVTGRADPARVVVNLRGAGVAARVPKPERMAWARIAMVNYLKQRNRAAIAAYSEASHA